MGFWNKLFGKEDSPPTYRAVYHNPGGYGHKEEDSDGVIEASSDEEAVAKAEELNREWGRPGSYVKAVYRPDGSKI